MSANVTLHALQIHVLGAPRITTPMGPVSPAKPFVFAAALYLGLNRGRVVRRDELATLLWPDATDAKRSERMRWLMRQLKLAGLTLAGGSPEIELATPDVLLDADTLATTSSAADMLALVRADVLAGYDPQVSDGFARWLDETRGTYRAHVLQTLATWLLTSRRSHSWRTMEAIARRMLALDDTRADAAAALADARHRQGTSSHDVADAHDGDLLVGRDDVLARLLEGLAPSSDAGHRLGVAGAAGIGKTRLVEELSRHAVARGIPVVTVRCQRGDALRPLSLAVDLTQALLQLPGALGASPQSLAVLGRFTGDQSSLDDSESPETRRSAVYGAVRDLIGAVTDEAGLVVIVDDAQWAEPGSWALLAPTLARRPLAPLCWAVTIRAESREQAVALFDTSVPRDDAVSEQERELFWLAPLEAADVERLCARRAAPRVIPPAALTALASRAAGIPFIAQALVDHWLEVGDVTSLPPSVARLVRSRLDRLSPQAAQLLRAIAVLDLDATLSAAEAVGPFDRREIVGAVGELEASGILRTVDGVLSAHALWIEAILSGTADVMAQILHRNAAEWLEQQVIIQEPVEPRHHWAVATHWLAARDEDRARRVLDHAANVLEASGFVDEAAAMLERAAELSGASRNALHYLRRSARLRANLYSSVNLENILRLHARYDAIAPAVLGDAFNAHHEVELLARWTVCGRHAIADDRVIIRSLYACATAATAPAIHRLKATTQILFRYPRGGLDEAAATVLWNAIATVVPTNEREAWEFEICATQYYARVANHPNRALAHSRRALAIATSAEKISRNDLSRMSGVADSYENMGLIEEAFALRRAMLDRGRMLNSRVLVVSALNGLVGTNLELGRPAEVRPLLAELGRAPSDHTTHVNMDRARAIYWKVCALEEGNATLARAELTVPLDAAGETNGMGRARILSIYAHLALLEGDETMLKKLLPHLLACFVDCDHFMDHPALMTATALERFQGWDAAAAFVRRFMASYREERFTPRPELTRFLELDAPAHHRVPDSRASA